MSENTPSKIPAILHDHEAELLEEWLETLTSSVRRSDLMSNEALRAQCAELLRLLRAATQAGGLTDDQGPEWNAVREMLGSVIASRARQGFTPRETALFILSLKNPLFARIRQEVGEDAPRLAAEILAGNDLLDTLVVWTTEIYLRTREEVIARQQDELLELSTPVVKLWEGILALPLIGTLDSARTQTVMENLLQTIVNTGAEIAIIDITGVPTVDTLTAQHLLKTVTAARLMGADCIISGIRPQIAQTIVHLGVELGDVTTKATLADAFRLALSRLQFTIGRAGGRS